MQASYTSSSNTSFADEIETVDPDCEVEWKMVPAQRLCHTLLHRLRSPASADRARRRKTKANPLPKGKRRCKGILWIRIPSREFFQLNQHVRKFSEEPLSLKRSITCFAPVVGNS